MPVACKDSIHAVLYKKGVEEILFVPGDTISPKGFMHENKGGFRLPIFFQIFFQPGELFFSHIACFFNTGVVQHDKMDLPLIEGVEGRESCLLCKEVSRRIVDDVIVSRNIIDRDRDSTQTFQSAIPFLFQGIIRDVPHSKDKIGTQTDDIINDSIKGLLIDSSRAVTDDGKPKGG